MPSRSPYRCEYDHHHDDADAGHDKEGMKGIWRNNHKTEYGTVEFPKVDW